jgi:AAA family ATPase
MAEGKPKTAIAWTAVENIQNTVVQTSRALQDRYNIKVGEKVAITKIDGCLQELASVILADITDAEKLEKYGEIPADERHYWEWALESNLSKCEVLANGLVFELDLKGQRRAFNVVTVQPQTPGYNNHTIFRFVSKGTKVSIGTDMGEAEEEKSSTRILVESGGLGGLSRQIEDINESLSDFNDQHKLVMPSFYQSNRGILIYGPKGTGKTTLLQQIEKAGWRQVFKIGSSSLGRSMNESESKLRNIFQEAVRSKPSVLIIDQLEFIAPKRNSPESQSLASVLCENLEAIRDASVLVVAATRHPNLVDDSLRTPHRLGTEIELQVPTAQDRAEILRALRGPVSAGLSDSFLDLLAEKTHGYVGADLFALLQVICRKARQRQSLEQGLSLQNLEISPSAEGEEKASVELDIQMSDMMSALQEIRPTAMREVFLETPKVRWSDIGGQKEIKERLQNAVERPLKVRTTKAPLFFVPKSNKYQTACSKNAKTQRKEQKGRPSLRTPRLRQNTHRQSPSHRSRPELPCRQGRRDPQHVRRRVRAIPPRNLPQSPSSPTQYHILRRNRRHCRPTKQRLSRRRERSHNTVE